MPRRPLAHACTLLLLQPIACNSLAASGGDRSAVQMLSLEGSIGAGKSTMLTSLRKQLADEPGVVFVEEQVERWEEAGLLQAMYDGSLSKAVFQQVALMSLAAGLFKALQTPGVRLVVSERSPHSNAIFAQVNLGGIEMMAYQVTLAQLLDALPADMERHASSPWVSKRGRWRIARTPLTDQPALLRRCTGHHARCAGAAARRAHRGAWPRVRAARRGRRRRGETIPEAGPAPLHSRPDD